MKILISLLFAATVISGCTATQVVKQKAADAFDSALYAAEQTTCNNASVGSIMRKYCNTKEGCQRWIDFCFTEGVVHDSWEEIAEGAE